MEISTLILYTMSPSVVLIRIRREPFGYVRERLSLVNTLSISSIDIQVVWLPEVPSGADLSWTYQNGSRLILIRTTDGDIAYKMGVKISMSICM